MAHNSTFTDEEVRAALESQLWRRLAKDLVDCRVPLNRRQLSFAVIGTSGLRPQRRKLIVDGVGPQDPVSVENFCAALPFDSADGDNCVTIHGQFVLYLREGLSSPLEDAQIALRTIRGFMADPSLISSLSAYDVRLLFREGIVDTTDLGSGRVGATPPSNGDESIAGIQQETVEGQKRSVTVFGGFIATAVGAGILLIALLAFRRRKYHEIEKVERLEVLDEGVWDERHVLPTSKDTNDLAVRSDRDGPKMVHILGDMAPSDFAAGVPSTATIVDDLRRSESFSNNNNEYIISEVRPRNKRVSFSDNLPKASHCMGFKHTGIDVHSCQSATCEICSARRKRDPTFIRSENEEGIEVEDTAFMGMAYAKREHYLIEDAVEI